MSPREARAKLQAASDDDDNDDDQVKNLHPTREAYKSFLHQMMFWQKLNDGWENLFLACESKKNSLRPPTKVPNAKKHQETPRLFLSSPLPPKKKKRNYSKIFAGPARVIYLARLA